MHFPRTAFCKKNLVVLGENQVCLYITEKSFLLPVHVVEGLSRTTFSSLSQLEPTVDRSKTFGRLLSVTPFFDFILPLLPNSLVFIPDALQPSAFSSLLHLSKKKSKRILKNDKSFCLHTNKRKNQKGPWILCPVFPLEWLLYICVHVFKEKVEGIEEWVEGWVLHPGKWKALIQSLLLKISVIYLSVQ